MSLESYFLSQGGVIEGQDEIKIRCVYHSPDKKPSLRVNLEKGVFHCFSCTARGKIKKLIQDIEDISEYDAGQILKKFGYYAGNKQFENQNGIGKFGSENKKRQFEFFEENCLNEFFPIELSQFKEYLKSRCIDLKKLNRYELFEGTDSLSENFVGRIVYPIRNIEEKICSIKGRSIYASAGLRYFELAGSDNTKGLYNIQNIHKKVKFLFVTEGVFDCISIDSNGFPAVALNSSEISDSQILQIRQRTNYPVLIFDGIKKGTERARQEVFERAKEKLSRNFVRYKIHVIEKEGQDLNSILCKKGKEYLKRYMTQIVKRLK